MKATIKDELTLPQQRARDLLARICEIRRNPGAHNPEDLFDLHAQLERVWIKHKDIDDLSVRLAELEGDGQHAAAFRLIDEIDARRREILDLHDSEMPLPEIDDLFGEKK